jgi:hypothetical protein
MNSESPQAPRDDEHECDEPTEEELVQMRAATAAEAAAVDAMVLAACARRWRKVAMVVGTTMNEFESKFPHLPFIYVQVRMQELEDLGAIEVQGDVMAMRHSEIRLAEATNAA